MGRNRVWLLIVLNINTKKNVTSGFSSANSPHARFTGMRIRHDGRFSHQDLLDFRAGDTMLATFRPVAVIPVETRNLHAKKVDICLHKCNATFFRALVRGPASSQFSTWRDRRTFG